MVVARGPSGTVCLAGCGSAVLAPECAEPAATATQSQNRYRSQGRTAAHTVREGSESIPESGRHCRTHSQGGVRVDTGVRAALPHTQSGRSQSRYRSQDRTAAHTVREESESIPESGPHCRTHSQGGVRVDTGVRAALPHTQSGRSQSRYRSRGHTAAHTVRGSQSRYRSQGRTAAHTVREESESIPESGPHCRTHSRGGVRVDTGVRAALPHTQSGRSQSRYRSQGRTAAHTVREESESTPESGPHCRTHSQGGVRVDTGVRAALSHTQSGRSQSRYRSQDRTAAHTVREES